ncbi:MAG: hypothetical protein A3C58_00525 [Candidatus Staskawiczbacteria bacterium RIFCSPHIGHO2_02_FULL_34_10]|uniref:DegT/DnrJ/EryC1/StrS aminotransferase n=1 Tax=Candidatus Staskawiczbacteria bacterium RIFCSPHIGHO2_02_FULL_34_10 TaxID=1802205 RepID=A0A1G2HU97_9BACT|nr:MAG: hypothetical protein A3C58_00525 [Candidatus Staskawiczbacteria bacterium RIFCSPHIGHO2_02_FULL_34_10]
MKFRFFQQFKLISISLSPNVQKDDVSLALKLLFQPWKWKRGKAIKELENQFKEYLGVKYAFSFNSGRSAFFAILKALDLEQNTNVSLQAFTCNAVPNPILWAGLNPVYIDCDNDFNVDIEKLKLLIRENKHSEKVVVVQHTFGLPVNMDEVMNIVQQNNLTLIEDCAHALGAEFGGKKVGTFGKASFFSFSRDKVISSVYGGMAITNDDDVGKKLQQLQKEFGQPSRFWIKQQLLHPILLHYMILPLYKFLDLGKIFLVLSQWLHVLSKAVSFKEKRGLRPNYFPKALPNALAILVLNQFNKLDKFNEHRKKIAEFYYNELKDTRFILPSKENNIFLRFAVRHPKAHEIIYDAWHKENMLLGDWYTTAIAPDDTKMDEMKYSVGMCKNAEKLAKETLNLPTHINTTIEDAKRIVNFLRQWR